MVTNTSFNTAFEPIVCTPSDAIASGCSLALTRSPSRTGWSSGGDLCVELSERCARGFCDARISSCYL